MNIFRQLLVVEAAALLALFGVAAAMAGYGAAESARQDNALLGPASSALVGFGYTLVIGLVPVIAMGAPGYLALLRHNLARWPYVLLLGIVPGLIALPFGFWVGFWAILCGASVASLTHLMCRRLGP